jgi:hypothetical protein
MGCSRYCTSCATSQVRSGQAPANAKHSPNRCPVNCSARLPCPSKNAMTLATARSFTFGENNSSGLHHAAAHRGREQLVLAASGVLGRIHCVVSVLHQLVWRLAVLGAKCNPDTRRNVHIAGRECEWAA